MFKSRITRCLTTVIGISLLLYLPAFPQTASQDKELLELIRERGQAKVVIKNPGRIAFDQLSRNVSVSRFADNQVFIVLSPVSYDWFIKQGYIYEIISPEDARLAFSARTKSEAMEWNSYPTWQQYDSIMNYYADNFPGLCRLDTIGKSINGRLVYALKISDNPLEDEEDEPKVFYSSTMHGDETGGYVLMLRLADHLLSGYSGSDRIRNLLDNLQIWINPLANPDGTYNTSDTIVSPVRFNAAGYDLNRNFPDPVVPDPPVLQKETLDMMRFMSEHRFVLSANFHSGAEVLNYPWDRWERLHADDNWFYSISRKYADSVHIYSEPGYMTMFDNGVTNGYQWYHLYGGRQDYVTYNLQGREITIEIDDNYVTPTERLDFLWEYNRESLIGYLENALGGIHGKVTDSKTGLPVPARIVIDGYDKDNSFVCSDTSTGRFVRLISPGSWNLTFSSNGYRDTTVTGIIGAPDQRYYLTVKMERILNPVDTTSPPQPLLYPNPADSFIKAVMPEGLKGNLNIRIFDAAGIMLRDYECEVYEGAPLIIDCGAMPSGVYTVVFRNVDTGMSSAGRFVVARQ